jgi:hypothetical protein
VFASSAAAEHGRQGADISRGQTVLRAGTPFSTPAAPARRPHSASRQLTCMRSRASRFSQRAMKSLAGHPLAPGQISTSTDCCRRRQRPRRDAVPYRTAWTR